MTGIPFISIVVPTCHRNDLLAKCLECLAPGQQAVDAGDYEVIVTDDGRRETAREMVAQRFPWARWVAGPKDGPAANRNNGAREARGEWIAFTDDDCLPQATWLGEIARIARENRAEVIEGRTLTPDKVDSPFRQGVENTGGGVFWSCNLAVKRAVFLDLGGFDEDFKEASDEDMEFGWRLRQRGCSWCFAAEALVLHPVRVVTWAGIWKKTKMRRWGELLQIKTGQAPALETSAPRVAACVAGRWILNMFRGTWHLVKHRHLPMRRTRLFWLLWEWMMFPFLLPYTLRWHFRFRETLRARARA